MKRHASMNRIYRLVWNATLGVMVAVAENAKGRGKSVSGRKLIAAALALTGGALMLPQAMAGPTGGQISAGTGVIAQAGSNTTITQTSQNLAINWLDFSIPANESVRFNQPNVSSVALNRVTSQNPSVILGNLSANGHVFVINPNGVLFGAGAQVDVGGLVASTLDMSDADLMAGKYVFSSSPGQARSSVVNQGTINIAPGGYVALLAPEVRNEGVIIADKGVALLAAGEKVTLHMNNGSLVAYSIDQGAIDALADNKQLIQADGGHIVMSAKAADALTTAVVNNTGVIRARTLQNVGGTIRLMGDMKIGTVNVGGTLDASAPTGGNGGIIETSAANVKVAKGANVTTAAAMGLNGTWLIDPADFTISSTVGPGFGDITGADLSALLALNDIVISTGPLVDINGQPLANFIDPVSGNPVSGVTTIDAAALLLGNFAPLPDPLGAPTNRPNNNLGGGVAGDIHVNDVVTWSANKLTLNAENNININANLNASGTASLALEYGQANVALGNTSNYYLHNGAKVNLPAGQNFSTKLGYDGATKVFTVITALGLDQNSLTMTDLQGINGNLAGNYVLGADIDATASSGWNVDPVTGGALGFTPIGGSNVAWTSAGGFTGVFDGLGHTVSNLTINTMNAPVVAPALPTASIYVGLFGQVAVGGLLQNVNLLDANIAGAGAVGALAGVNHGTINNSSTTVTVAATLAAPASGAVTGYGYGIVTAPTAMASTGGLVGANYGAVNDSSASGSVSGTLDGESVGGLVGINAGTVGGTLGIGSHSSAAVSSNGSISGSLGGLVGVNTGTINNSYATGSVTDNAIASGVSATMTSRVGGLVGYNNKGRLNNSYYDISAVALNGALGVLSAGGLYNSQYQAWTTTTTNLLVTDPLYHVAYNPLDIANYASLQMLPALPGALTAVYGISDVQGLQDMLAFSEDSGYSFQLTASVDLASAIPGAAAPGFFVPYFAGNFDGNNLTIANLSLTDATVSGVAALGMFGQTTDTANISNLGVTNATISVTSTGAMPAGAGGATASKVVGGLVGLNEGVIGNSYVTGTVSAVGEDNVGGLVGDNASTGQITFSHATANVTGATNVGGLVGVNEAPVLALALSANIDNSYAETGTVNGVANVGGLIGNNFGNVATSYSAENVTGTGSGVGGLVGINNSTVNPAALVTPSSITDSYSTGRVTGAGYTGGLVGTNYGNITNAYATGAVSGPVAGGLTGMDSGAGLVTNAFWDTLPATGTGQVASVTGTGLTTTQMHQQASFTGFDFTSATAPWVMYQGYTAPLLRSFLAPLTVTAGNVSKVFDGQTGINPNNVGLTYTDGNGVPVTPNFAALLFAAPNTGATFTGAGSAVGVYAITAPAPDLVLNQPANTGLYSTQQGYLISYATTAPATLTVTAAPVPPVPPATAVPLANALGAYYAGLQLNEKRHLKNDCEFDQTEDDCSKLPGVAKKHILTVKDGGISLPDNGAHLVLPQM